MFNAKVYTTAVILLSGIMDETFAAKEAVRRWNEAGAQRTGRLFLLVDDPQAADVLVGVVGNHLEGAQRVAQALEAGRRVLLLFSSFADPRNTIASEQTAVAAYMRQMAPRCHCAQFNGPAELCALLTQQLNEIQ